MIKYSNNLILNFSKEKIDIIESYEKILLSIKKEIENDDFYVLCKDEIIERDEFMELLKNEKKLEDTEKYRNELANHINENEYYKLNKDMIDKLTVEEIKNNVEKNGVDLSKLKSDYGSYMREKVNSREYFKYIIEEGKKYELSYDNIYINSDDDMKNEGSDDNKRGIDLKDKKLLVMSIPKSYLQYKIDDKENDYNIYKLTSLWGIHTIRDIFESLNNYIPYENKISKAIWRGSTAGNINLYNNKKNWKYTRLEIIKKCKERPDIIDAKITNVVQYCLERYERFIEYFDLNDTYNKSLKMKIAEQIKYKYIIIADGNVNTYGLFWALGGNVAVLKQESDYVQYFETDIYHEPIQEWIHYVPIKRDFSDLIEKIEWLNNNENEGKKISNNAYNYAMKYFNVKNFKDVLLKSIKN